MNRIATPHQAIFSILCALNILSLASGASNTSSSPTVAPAPGPVQTQGVPWFPDKEKITVCTSEWTPAVKCDGLDPLMWSGYEIELFKELMPFMGWTNDMIEWRCLDWDVMLDLLANTSECDLAPAGMAPYQERIDMGMRFSVATLQSGLAIMVKSSQSTPGRWYFFSAMETSVWVTMIFSGFLVGFVVWVYEVGMKALDHDTKYLRNPMWDSVGRPVQMRDYRLSSTAANTVGLAWSFTVFILMALYTANLTANLTVTQINNAITGVSDLPGKAVASWSGYAEDLQDRYSLKVIPYEWNGESDEQKMIDDLLSGLVVAIVLDDSALRNMDASNCDTMLVGGQFDLTDQTIGLPKSTWTNYDFVDALNLNIRWLWESHEIERLKKDYIEVNPADCKTDSLQNTYSQVTWDEASGLWFILLIAVLTGLLLVFAYRMWLYVKPSMIQKRWFQSWFPFLVPKSALNRSLHTMVQKGLSNRLKRDDSSTGHYMDSEDWDQYKYQGTPQGYIDGSSDVHVSNSGPASPKVFPYRSSTFQTIVIDELAQLKAQIAELSKVQTR